MRLCLGAFLLHTGHGNSICICDKQLTCIEGVYGIAGMPFKSPFLVCVLTSAVGFPIAANRDGGFARVREATEALCCM